MKTDAKRLSVHRMNFLTARKIKTVLLSCMLGLALLGMISGLHAQSVDFSALHQFNGNDGANPEAALLQAKDGNFYGTASQGGSGGSVFELTPAGTLTTLFAFQPYYYPQGNDPRAALIQGTDGNFYGTTYSGDYEGVIFSVSLTGNETVLAELYNYESGIEPTAALIQGRDGNFYGTTTANYGDGSGTVFEVTPAGSLTTLHTFDGSDGAGPATALIQGSDGNFYGTTPNGGTNGSGTVFKITSNGNFFTVYNFSAEDGNGKNTDGSNPYGALFQGSGGNFYGTTTSGGANGSGTIFKLTSAGVLTTLHNFAAKDATGKLNSDGFSADTLIQGNDGNFYGVATLGGTSGNGTAFRMTPAGAVTVLHTFSAEDGNGHNNDGVQPYDHLIQGNDGNFYGTASGGGTNGDGTIFELIIVPLISSAPTASGKIGQAFSYQIVADHTPTSYGVQGLPPGLSVDSTTGKITGTPKTAGTFTLALHAYNSYGKGSATLTLNVLPDMPPVVTSAAKAGGTVSTAFSYQITATNLPTSFGVQGLPPGLTLNATSGLVSGTPTVAGKYTLTLNAYNNAGKGSATLALTIQPIAPPVITSAETATGKADTAFSYQITASNLPTGFGVQGLPAGLSVDATTGLISGTSKVAGTFTMNLNAYNSYGKGSGMLTITFQPDKPPVITSPTTATGTIGQYFSYQITGTNNPTSFGVQGLASGLSLNAHTGLISGTPDTAGTFTLTVNAYNAYGKGSATLTLTINSD